MELTTFKNLEGKDIYRLYDDNGKSIMEEDVVSVKVGSHHSSGLVVIIGAEAFRISNGTTSQVIAYEDIEKLVRVKGFEE